MEVVGAGSNSRTTSNFQVLPYLVLAASRSAGIGSFSSISHGSIEPCHAAVGHASGCSIVAVRAFWFVQARENMTRE